MKSLSLVFLSTCVPHKFKPSKIFYDLGKVVKFHNTYNLCIAKWPSIICILPNRRYLGVVYTMGQLVVPRSCKICDWLFNFVQDHFGLHQGKNVKVTMEFEVPKRHILGPTLSTDMVQRALWWERKNRCSSIKRLRPMAKK